MSAVGESRRAASVVPETGPTSPGLEAQRQLLHAQQQLNLTGQYPGVVAPRGQLIRTDRLSVCDATDYLCVGIFFFLLTRRSSKSFPDRARSSHTCALISLSRDVDSVTRERAHYGRDRFSLDGGRRKKKRTDDQSPPSCHCGFIVA